MLTCFGLGLCRQSVHQIETDVGKARTSGFFIGSTRLIIGVPPSEQGKLRIVCRLNAERETVKADGTVVFRGRKV